MTRRRAGSRTREETASVAHIEQREFPDATRNPIDARRTQDIGYAIP
jgi:hypothetical protein